MADLPKPSVREDAVILLLGGSGYIGTAFRQQMDRDGIDYVTVSRSACNYYDRGQLRDLIHRTRTDFLINAAGYTGVPNVDACEQHKAECLSANSVLPGMIRQVCEQELLPWGHVSSGCIYSGGGAHEFRETDPSNFSFRQGKCSFYSGSKALGEEMLEGAERCYIWRLRIPFNHVDSPRNYLSKLMRYERLLDVRNSLSHLDEYVAACLQCWRDQVDFGVYNLTNTGSLTTRQIVDMIHQSGICQKPFEFFESEAEFMRVAAVAPRSSCALNNSKALSLGLQFSSISEAVRRSLSSWQWTNSSPYTTITPEAASPAGTAKGQA